MLVARRPSAHNAASTPGTAVPPRNRHEPCLTYEANQRLAVNLNHFRLLRVVGRGAFGKVRIVERKDTNLSFALKYIRKDEGKRTNQFWHLSTCSTTRPKPRHSTLLDSNRLERINHVPGADLASMKSLNPKACATSFASEGCWNTLITPLSVT